MSLFPKKSGVSLQAIQIVLE